MPLWIYTTVEVVLNCVEINSFQDILYYYLFPTNYWFAISIVILYALYYVTLKFNLYKSFRIVVPIIFSICVLFIFMLVLRPSIAFLSLEKLTWNTFSLDSPYLCMQLIWFVCMLIGATDTSSTVNSKITFSCYALIILGLVLYCVPKLVEKMYDLVSIEVFLPVSYIIFSVGMFSLLQKNENFFQKNKSKLRVTKLLSRYSLEEYYVQFIWIDLCRSIVFPLNIIVMMIGIVLSAYVLNRISGMLYKKIWRCKT